MKVLIVDDLRDIREFVKRILTKRGIECDIAENGATALEKAKSCVYDLVLLDIQLPDIDGYDVCKQFKQLPESTDVPVIFLTALEKADQVVKGLKAGAVDYIRKPFDKKELLARVMVHLDLRKTKLDLMRQVADNLQLVHILCHDLANPITGTVGLLDVMEDDVEGLMEIIPTIKQSLDLGLDLIELVRTMAAIEEGKIDVKLDVINLVDAISESKLILNSRFQEKSLSLNLDIPKATEVLVEKASFVSSVINNLLTNAVKFSFPDSRIDISAKNHGDYVNLAIRDYGIGMPQDLLQKIFDMNAKTSRKGTGNEVGTGFGMPLVKRFVESYGGSIEILSWEETDENQPNGTEIRLQLKRPR